MLKTAVVLLALTAAGGLIMAFIRFSGTERPPSWLAMGHGLLAGSGLTLLLYQAFTTGLPTMALLGVATLVVAAAGGAFLNLAYHAQLKALPKGIVVVHALLAVAGFALLALAAFR
jgi:hypothetical protein